MVRDLTRGNPVKLILSFSFPLLLGNLFQQMYSMADTIVVGQSIGAQALAAVGSTGAINFLVLGFVLGTCSGFCIPVAQFFGAGDWPNMRRAIAHVIYLGAAIALLLTVAMLFFTRPILVAMQTPIDIIDSAYAYIIVIFAGICATMLYNILAGILRSVGDTRTPLIFLVIASIINILLDLLLIPGLGVGVEGAAYATVVSQLISGLLCFLYIKKNYPILKLEKKDFAFDAMLTKRILFSGLPMGLQFSVTAIGNIILQSAINSLGSGIIASITAGNRVQSLVIQPLETMGITMATYSGQNLGAGRIDRISEGVKKALLLSLGVSLLSFLLMYFLGSHIALLFLKPDEVTLIGNVQQFLRINAFFLPFLGVLFVLRNALQGMGYALHAVIGGVIELGMRSFVSICLVSQFGFFAVCFAGPSAWVGAVLYFTPMFIYALRKLRRRFHS